MMCRIPFILFLLFSSLLGQVKVGIDVLFEEGYDKTLLRGKRIGLITNQTAVDAQGITTLEHLSHHKDFQLKAIFAPEHGFYGAAYACEYIDDATYGHIPIYSLHAEHRRPKPEHLKDIDILIFDIQDIGSRSYTYIGTLCYCMEEAAKAHLPFIVLDRPNPQGGLVVDGPLVDEAWRSFLGYLNVPYCHGMTMGELALLFNQEYTVGCDLTVVPMKGWKRGMTFSQTGICWVPTSPQIPEPDTAFFYSTTGILGQYASVSIGIGYTLPFKVVGAPWINAEQFAAACQAQKLPGAHFQPFYFRPFFGRYKNELCKGILIVITDPNSYLPATTGYVLTGVLKNLYPQQFEQDLKKALSEKNGKDGCHKINGREQILDILCNDQFVIWKLRQICQKDTEQFLPLRKKYLFASYN